MTVTRAPVGAVAVLALVAVGCGGHPVRRGELERRVRAEYHRAGSPRATVQCVRRGSTYRCTIDLGGDGGSDGFIYKIYSLTGHQESDTSGAIP
jgi:hypothetical protein